MRSTCVRLLQAASAGLASAPGSALAQLGPVPPVVGAAALPHDLSPWGMFLSADIVVKAVMMGLALASVLTWTVWFAKSLELLAAKRRARAALQALAQSGSLAEAAGRLSGPRTAVAKFVAAATFEAQRSAGVADREAVKERVVARLERAEVAANRAILRGTGILATIGATAPFVGLFGTVWGIMNSFIGISKAHTTNLAVVAPGIAEALLATAFGLFAAIPAVVVYNLFTRRISAYRDLLGDASAEVLILLDLDLERRDLDRREPVRPLHRHEPKLAAE